jgi:hypothetical protein
LSIFWERFSTWKNICMIFLNSPYRETPEHVLKKKTRKQGAPQKKPQKTRESRLFLRGIAFFWPIL